MLKESVDFNEELLPHVLFGDLTRWVIDLYRKSHGHADTEKQRTEILDRTLCFLETRFRDSEDTAAQDLIAVSFLENLHQAGSDYQGIKERLGPALQIWLTRLE
ncbi:MAG: hypothetical protein M3024_04435 [Candidatus Dormibacteraeota bacterium]|nr:hypothetical protein [Candidatus Dormibacteraeota bacterium]MDQ6900270.1 hypothetical protein [Candidatus Dormibacteraeota bacterium]